MNEFSPTLKDATDNKQFGFISLRCLIGTSFTLNALETVFVTARFRGIFGIL
jgi:hypothetical protein